MGMFDDMQNKSDSIMNNPETREKIEQLAKEKGISMESAKVYFMEHGAQTE